MKPKNIFYLLLMAVAIGACSKDDIHTFDLDESGIYFQYGGQARLYQNIDAYYDSLSYSFSTAREDLTDTILYTRVRTMGKVRDYDRTFSVSVDAENTTAVEGVHYTIDYTQAVIPAGESEIKFPVKFMRTADLMEKRVSLTLRLNDNENFKVYFDEQKNTNIYNATGEQIQASTFKFVVSEIYTKPSYWSFMTELGTWSVTKMRLVCKLFDVPISDWNRGGYADSKVQAGYSVPWAFKLRRYLQEAADNGNPVKDDDGSYMQLGTGYEVDYSAYL